MRNRILLAASACVTLLAALSVPSASAQPAPGKDAGPAAKADGGATHTSGDAGAAPATAATAASGDAGATPLAQAPMAATASPAAARKFTPPPPPTPAQIAALQTFKGETEEFERGARGYRDTVTAIIRLHYEQKKKEILGDLDAEISIEKGELKKARDNAISRLERFVADYSGSRANVKATPDAMYRLAALYEERARSEEATEPVEDGIKPAIALYKRIIREYPKYGEVAGVHYFLGHAYNDSGRTAEAQQVWRALVCHNKFKYPTPPDPKNPDRDTIIPLPQDHDEVYWSAWRSRHRDAKQLRKGEPDTQYEDPYPKSCEPLPQPNLRPGDDPKYVAEIWWQIGNWEFDQLDFGSGVVRDEPASVYGFNRASSAYNQSMRFKKPPLYGVSLYKDSWTLFKQQRFEAATREFITLLLYTDEQQKLTGDPGADFRGEAFTYIAGSLTNIDFTGPGPDDPYIQRPDIIDTESRPDVVEKKLHVAIDRVRDPSLIPQDKSWTFDIYNALAEEFRSLNQYNNAIEVYELMLKNWPMHPEAPSVQAGIADAYEQIANTKKTGTPEHEAVFTKALEARTKLSNYIGTTPWTEANKDNPGALRKAERLVRGGLRQAAVQHTNNGRGAVAAATETGDAARQLELLTRASTEYKLAATGWKGYLTQDENAPDAYESRYWLADAHRNAVRIQVALHKIKPSLHAEPGRQDIDVAKAAAIDARDSNEDDKFLDNAALFVVDIADVDRDLAYQLFEDSKGAQGIEKREEVKFKGESEKTVQVDTVPPVVLQSIQARDEYVGRVPATLDVQGHALDYAYYAGETFFLYGQFELARARFEPMYKENCGKNKFGYLAWEKLITMSNLSKDLDRSTKLAEEAKAKSCATNEAEEAKGALIINPTIQEASYVRARAKFEEAKAAPPGDAKNKLWREAGGLYEAALSAAPARDEAPEAAMNAAYAYKQVGEVAKAIELYNKFISEYGNEDRLNKLQKGDPKTKAPADPKKYEERLRYLNDAYDALGTTYYSFFNYQRAAETYEKVANSERFDSEKRKVASKNAMVLYANMGQRDKMNSQYKVYVSLKPSAEEKTSADYLIATYDYKQWNPKGGDTGQNRTVRQNAQTALEDFNRKAPAGKYKVEAMYFLAKMKKTVGENNRAALKAVVAAWEDYKRVAPAGKDGKSAAFEPPYVDYAAEADFTMVDEDIKEKYDSDTRHKYAGSIEEILGKFDPKTQKTIKAGKYQTNADEADKWDKQLERIVRTYPSLEWVPATLARQGSIWDSLRTGLYNTVPPALKYYTPAQEKFLKQMEESGRPELEDKAAEIRDATREGWRAKKESELKGSDTLMIRRYASAVALAKKYNVKNAQTARAISRLAYFTDILGDPKMKDYVTQTADPSDASKKLDYKDHQYVQSRPGMASVAPPNGLAPVLPVAP
ncbi:MAG: tetratricopeptide repeat protein [Polyangiaceae bacterium]